MNKLVSAPLGVGVTAVAVAGRPLMDDRAVMDSLRQMPRLEQVRWLAKRGLADPYLRDRTPVGDSGLRCVRRWSYGPSTFVDIRATPTDTIVFLSRGSGISIIRFRSQDSLRLDLLSDINSHGLTDRCQVRDTLLYVNSGGVECYDIGNLTSPVLLNWLSQPLMYDFFIVDTFLYTSSRDSLRIFSVSDPASPRALGACADSGYVMYVSGGHAYLGHQAGLFVLDVTNPAAPHRVAALGFDVLSIWVKDTLLCFGTYDSTFKVYNVEDPTAPAPVGGLDGVGAACLYLSPACDTVIYTPSFDVISVANPSTPHRVGSVSLPGWEYGVAVVPALNAALVADYYEGLVSVDIRDPADPAMDTQQYAADEASDIRVEGSLAYVADLLAGMRILDISDPTRPTTLGGIDSLSSGVRCPSVAVKDSFSFMGVSRPWFRSVDVSDPAHPLMAGACAIPTEPQDMVVRDSFAYAAINYEFDVINVARLRQPVVVGTCALRNASLDLFVSDSLAYVGNWPSPIISISDPTHPEIVGSFAMPLGGVYVRDTFAYLAMSYDSMFVYSVANPALPVRLGSLDFSGGQQYAEYDLDIEVLDTIAYIGGWHLKTVSVADPRNPREVGERWNPPSYIPRLTYAAPYLYVACSDAGVCIMETLQTGISEPARRPAASRISVAPSLTRGPVHVTVNVTGRVFDLEVFDVTGNLIQKRTGSMKGAQTIDLTSAPDGAYLVMVKTEVGVSTTKVVKTKK